MRSAAISVLILGAALLLCPGAYAGQDADFQRAKGYYTLQEYEMAVAEFAKFAAAYPQSERIEDARLMSAESQYQLKHFAEAAKSFGAFLESYPKSAHRSDALMRAIKSSAAVQDFTVCLKYAEDFVAENRDKVKAAGEKDPLPLKFATALYHAGDCSYALKDAQKARKYWEELLATMPGSPLAADASDGLGWIYFDLKEFDKAAASFHKTAETPNHSRAAWAKLMEGRSLAALKKTDEAFAAFRQAPTLTGSDKTLETESALRVAENLLDTGKVSESVEFFKALAGLAPTAPATQAALATAASKSFESKHFAEAVELASLYAKSSENSAAADRPAIARIKARALLALDKKDDALEAAKIALSEAAASKNLERKKTDHPAALLLLAELDKKQAPALLKEAAEAYPATKFALSAEYELARSAADSGQLAEGLGHLESMLKQAEKVPADPATDHLVHDGTYAAGQFAFQLKDYKKALGYFKVFRDGTPDDPRADDAASKMAWSLHEMSADAEAVKLLDDEILKKLAKSPLRAEMLYLRSLAAEKLNLPQDTLKFDEQLIQEAPQSPFATAALYDAAAHQYTAKQFEPALGNLNTLLARAEIKDDLKNRALQLRATMLLNTGKSAQALADAEELLKNPGSDSKLNYSALRLIKALALAAQPGKESEALKALNETIAQSPATSPEAQQALTRRAYLLFKDKQFAEAKPDFIKLADPAASGGKWTPETVDAALHLALIHRELKEIDPAKAVFEKIVNQTEVKLEGIPAFEAPLQLGNILFEKGDNAAALKMYDQALASAPAALPRESLSAARLNRAWALRRLNEKEKAAEAFGALAKEDADGHYTSEALLERARLLVELGKHSDALPPLKDLLEHFKDAPQAEAALFLEGQVLARSGQFKEAADAFELFTTQYKSPSVREAFCGLGESRLQNKEADKAKEAFLKALGPKGLDADLDDIGERALLGLADIALKQSDPGQAKKLAIRILAEDPKSEWADAAYLIAGQCSEALKEPEKAIGYYRKLIAERPKSSHVPAAEERLRTLGAPK